MTHVYAIVSSLFTGSLTWSLGQTYGTGVIAMATGDAVQHASQPWKQSTCISREWLGADPRFPGGGWRTLQRGRQPIIQLIFPKNCIKVKKTGPTLGLVPLWEILDPPLWTYNCVKQRIRGREGQSLWT